LKKSLLLLTLMAFLASPMALPPEAEAASRTQNKTHKVKAGKAKSKTAKTGKQKPRRSR
jgi:Ni/Co efflux regulator RcnB